MRRKQARPVRRAPGTIFVVARIYSGEGGRVVIASGAAGEHVWAGNLALLVGGPVVSH